MPYVWSGGSDSALPSPFGPNYGVAADVLRVLYFGRDHNNVTACNSTLRNALAASAAELFEGPAGPTGALRHLFRHDDTAGATESLRSLTGVPASVPFCNGSSSQDNDPIRRTCAGSEDVCEANGTLGLVLPIAVPKSSANSPYGPGAVPLPVNPATGSTAANCAVPGGARCTSGAFQYAAFPGLGTCPDGVARSGGQCRVPVFHFPYSCYDPTTGGTQTCWGSSFQCVNAGNNRPSGFTATFDARVYNLVSRNNTTGAPIVNAPSAFYRMHETRAFHGCGCKDAATSKQIGCLVGASDVSLAFTNRDASNSSINWVAALASYSATNTTPNAGLLPSDATIRTVVSSPTYPFARKLYIHSIRGWTGDCSPLTPHDFSAPCFFDGVSLSWPTLASRVLNNLLVDSIATAADLIPDPRSSVAIEEQGVGPGRVCF